MASHDSAIKRWKRDWPLGPRRTVASTDETINRPSPVDRIAGDSSQWKQKIKKALAAFCVLGMLAPVASADIITFPVVVGEDEPLVLGEITLVTPQFLPELGPSCITCPTFELIDPPFADPSPQPNVSLAPALDEAGWEAAVSMPDESALAGDLNVPDDPKTPNLRIEFSGKSDVNQTGEIEGSASPGTSLGTFEFAAPKSAEGQELTFVGQAFDANGELLTNSGSATVVPEPTAIALLALACLGLLCCLRCRS